MMLVEKLKEGMKLWGWYWKPPCYGSSKDWDWMEQKSHVIFGKDLPVGLGLYISL